MLTRGIVFYIYGESHKHLIAPCICSLRLYYKGPIHFALDGKISDSLVDSIQSLDNCTYNWYNRRYKLQYKRRQAIWCKKAEAHEFLYPFDLNLYYDIDHIFVNKVNPVIWEVAEHYGLTSSCYSERTQSPKREQRLIHTVNTNLPHFCGDMIKWFPKANGGCVCARKDSKELEHWLKLIPEIGPWGREFRFNPEERALAICLASGYGIPLPKFWSECVQEDQYNLDELQTDQTIAWHFPRKRWEHCKVWHHYADLCKAYDFMNYKEHCLK